MLTTVRPNIFHSQNFLKDPCLVAKLIENSSIGPDDLVYEIGPGKGMITEQLALSCKHVVAIEKDPRLAAVLIQKYAQRPNVTIYEGDFLQDRLPRTPYKVFANIPFNLTSAIISRLTSVEIPPQDAYLAMQKEAANMYLGKPRETLRAVLLKPWFDIEIVHRFHRGDFVPQPRVDAVMLRLRKRGSPLVSRKHRQRFRDFVVYGFTAWRPTLAHVLKGIFTGRQIKNIRRDLKINLDTTPTAIPFEQWLKLFDLLNDAGFERAAHLISGSEKRLNRQQRKLSKIHRTRIFGHG